MHSIPFARVRSSFQRQRRSSARCVHTHSILAFIASISKWNVVGIEFGFVCMSCRTLWESLSTHRDKWDFIFSYVHIWTVCTFPIVFADEGKSLFLFVWKLCSKSAYNIHTMEMASSEWISCFSWPLFFISDSLYVAQVNLQVFITILRCLLIDTMSESIVLLQPIAYLPLFSSTASSSFSIE